MIPLLNGSFARIGCSRLTIAVGLVLTCVGAPLSAQSAAPSVDTPHRTPSGVAYIQPKDWQVVSQPNITLITAPEGDLTLAVVQIAMAATAQEATTRAWALYHPGPAPVSQLINPIPPQSGWDERVSFGYETPPAAKRAASALALRKGTTWIVMLLDGSESTIGKRSAAVGVIQQSLLPAGYQKESFAGRTARRLTPERIALMH